MMKQIQHILITALLVLSATGVVFATDADSCSKLLLTSDFLKAYEHLITSEVGKLISVQEIDEMLATGNHFTLSENGPSEKSHIHKALNQLKNFADQKILQRHELQSQLSEILKKILKNVNEANRQSDAERKARAISKPSFVDIHQHPQVFGETALINGGKSIATKYSLSGLALSSKDEELNIWNVEDGKLLTTFKDAFHSNTPMIVTSDSKYLITQQRLERIGIWDLSTYELHKGLDLGRYDSFKNLELRQNGDLLTFEATIRNKDQWPEYEARTMVWSLKDEEYLFETKGEFHAMSAQGEFIFSDHALFQKSIFWKYRKTKALYYNSSYFPQNAEFTNDEKFLTITCGVANSDNQLDVWDTFDKKHLWTKPGPIYQTKTSPDNKSIFVLSTIDQKPNPSLLASFELRDLQTGNVLFTFDGNFDYQSKFAVSSDGEFVAASSFTQGSTEGTISVWDMKTKKMKTFLGPVNQCYFKKLYFTDDNKKLILVTGANGIRIFDLTQDQ